MKAEAEAIEERRSRMRVAVPSLSSEALAQLDRLEKVRRANPDAYSTEAAMMVGRASLNGEIARFREAVEQRFGAHDFRKGVEAVAGRVPAEERDRLAKAAPSIAAALGCAGPLPTPPCLRRDSPVNWLISRAAPAIDSPIKSCGELVAICRSFVIASSPA